MSMRVGDLAVDAAQAVLTGFDTACSKLYHEESRTWRYEDRSWREEDLSYRDEERSHRNTEVDWREEDRRWRSQDNEQRALDNGRWVWSRFVEKNRRDVEEKSEQLKTISNLSALIAGFAVVALVELQFHETGTKPHQSEWIIAAYGSFTSITVGLMMNSMIICSMMLSAILKNGKTYVSEEEESDFLLRCRSFAAYYRPGKTPPQPRRTFDKTWETRCESQWRLALALFRCGVPCFLASLVFAGWLKFDYSPVTGSLITVICVGSFIFWCYIQRRWAGYLVENFGDSRLMARRGSSKAEGLPFDWHALKAPPPDRPPNPAEAPLPKKATHSGMEHSSHSGISTSGSATAESAASPEQVPGQARPEAGGEITVTIPELDPALRPPESGTPLPSVLEGSSAQGESQEDTTPAVKKRSASFLRKTWLRPRSNSKKHALTATSSTPVVSSAAEAGDPEGAGGTPSDAFALKQPAKRKLSAHRWVKKNLGSTKAGKGGEPGQTPLASPAPAT